MAKTGTKLTDQELVMRTEFGASLLCYGYNRIWVYNVDDYRKPKLICIVYRYQWAIKDDLIWKCNDGECYESFKEIIVQAESAKKFNDPWAIINWEDEPWYVED